MVPIKSPSPAAPSRPAHAPSAAATQPNRVHRAEVLADGGTPDEVPDGAAAAAETARRAAAVPCPTVPNEYDDYARLSDLLRLQHPRTDATAELSFLIVTQVMELYFALLRHEWEAARTALAADDVRTALTALRRGHGAQDALTGSWEALRTLTPAEFDAFRESFGVASGIQSYQYRHVEFLLGARHPKALAIHDRTPGIQAELRAQAARPSLYDAALLLLARRGYDVPPDVAVRDYSTQYEGDDRAVAVWRDVYSGPRRDDALIDLADALFDTADRHVRWKQRHLLSVWRSMGDKPGSAGSSGASWLERGVHRKYFPDLWTLRDGGWA